MAGSGPGDPAQGFDALFGAQRPEISRLCRRMLGPGGSDEDALHEVFLRGRGAFERFDRARPFRPWILRIAGNHCLDVLRRRSRETRLFDAADLDASGLEADAGPSPLRHALLVEQRDRVVGAIDALPHRYRLPLVLRYFQELDYDGIADVLHLDRGQVATLLFRAKRRLRRALEEDAT